MSYEQVSKVGCINHAGFTLKFKLVWDGGETGWSRHILSSGYGWKLIPSLPSGPAVKLRARAIGGKTKHCNKAVYYDPGNDAVAFFVITGTTLNINCHLLG